MSVEDTSRPIRFRILHEEPFDYELWRKHKRAECHIGCSFCVERYNNQRVPSPFYGGIEEDVLIPGVDDAEGPQDTLPHGSDG